eukprot:CFRG4105T1
MMLTTSTILVFLATYVQARCSIDCSNNPLFPGDRIDSVAVMENYPDAYEMTDLRGTWHQVFAIDNTRSTATQTYIETYTVGYSQVDSSTTTEKWSTEAGVEFKGLTTKFGYEKTVSLYNAETWTTSSEKSLQIDVPARESANIQQRVIEADLTWVNKVCSVSSSSPITVCFQPDGDNYMKFWASVPNLEPFFSYGNFNPDSDVVDCGKCKYQSQFQNITLGFASNCYTNNANTTEADAYCPVYSESSTPTMLKSSQNTVQYNNNDTDFDIASLVTFTD